MGTALEPFSGSGDWPACNDSVSNSKIFPIDVMSSSNSVLAAFNTFFVSQCINVHKKETEENK